MSKDGESTSEMKRIVTRSNTVALLAKRVAALDLKQERVTPEGYSMVLAMIFFWVTLPLKLSKPLLKLLAWALGPLIHCAVRCGAALKVSLSQQLVGWNLPPRHEWTIELRKEPDEPAWIGLERVPQDGLIPRMIRFHNPHALRVSYVLEESPFAGMLAPGNEITEVGGVKIDIRCDAEVVEVAELLTRTASLAVRVRSASSTTGPTINPKDPKVRYLVVPSEQTRLHTQLHAAQPKEAGRSTY